MKPTPQSNINQMLPIKGPLRQNSSILALTLKDAESSMINQKCANLHFFSSCNEIPGSMSDDGPYPGPKWPAKMSSRNPILVLGHKAVTSKHAKMTVLFNSRGWTGYG